MTFIKTGMFTNFNRIHQYQIAVVLESLQSET